jgi:N-succinyldiaminopimelate aminotransferase
LGEAGFDPIAALERAITPRTCAIYVNTPHNPTGRILPDSVLDGIAELARKHELWVIADEAYEDVWFGREAPRSFFARSGVAPFTVTTHSVSKAYALAGARIGYTHAAPELMDVIRGVQTFYSYCATRPMQFSAARALDAGDAWLANMRATYAQAARAAAAALEVPTPEGGTFLFFDVTRFLRRSETLAELLERCLDAGVMLTPGTSCGDEFGGSARLCFTTLPPDELQEALERLHGVLFR